MFREVGHTEGYAVHSLQRARWSRVVEEQALFKAAQRHTLDVLQTQAHLFLDLAKARQGRMRPSTRSPLLVVCKVHLHSLSQVRDQILGIGQVGPVRCEAAPGQVRAETPRVGTPG